MSHPIIHFDYEFSPVGQKTKLVLAAAGVDFKRCDQPPVLPRKDLEALGITFRRIPVLAVGKDLYCDSNLIIDLILNKLAKNKVPTSTSDKAWAAWGYDSFESVLLLIPLEVLSKDFLKDREGIFPIIQRSDYASLRPSGVSEIQSRLAFLENEVLTNGTYIGGDRLSVADIHAIFGLRWGLNDLGAQKEAQLNRDAFPKVWKLIDSLPAAKPEVLSGEDTENTIEKSEYSAEAGGIAKDDPLGIKAGTSVAIESMDSTPGSNQQKGKLIASSAHEFVLELPNGIHLHFPRVGYIVREASS